MDEVGFALIAIALVLVRGVRADGLHPRASRAHFYQQFARDDLGGDAALGGGIADACRRRLPPCC